jgi:hypothetical protein
VNEARVTATVPVIACGVNVPEALGVNEPRVTATVPLMPNTPVAVDVNAASVTATVPVIAGGVNVPEALGVNEARVTATVPVMPVDAGARATVNAPCPTPIVSLNEPEEPGDVRIPLS